MLPMSGVVYLTHNCFLKCKHCFLVDNGKINEKAEIPFNKVIEMLDDFKENKVFMVAYTGGDPLLHPNIFEILNETYKRNMMPLLGISGMGLTNEIAKKIYDSGVRCVQVSLDGSNEELNARYRGKGVFDEVCNSINILQKNGIKTNLAVCINNENFNDYKNIIQFAYEKNIYKMKIAFWNDFGNCKKFTCINGIQKKEVTNFYKKFEEDHKMKDWILCLDGTNDLVNIHNKALVIDANGNVRNSDQGEVLGNINLNKPSFYFNN